MHGIILEQNFLLNATELKFVNPKMWKFLPGWIPFRLGTSELNYFANSLNSDLHTLSSFLSLQVAFNIAKIPSFTVCEVGNVHFFSDNFLCRMLGETP